MREESVAFLAFWLSRCASASCSISTITLILVNLFPSTSLLHPVQEILLTLYKRDESDSRLQLCTHSKSHHREHTSCSAIVL